MPRSLDQNALLHVFIQEIVDHMRAMGMKGISTKIIKGLIKAKLGNYTELLGEKIVMSTTDYKKHENQLTAHDLKHGFISMDCLMTKIVAWASTDLNLELKSINEE
ncbi:MAG: hypothetical protein JKY50_12890 [Oleispira sp.]|nr:hypothetical protein [Oleispira sp.]